MRSTSPSHRRRAALPAILLTLALSGTGALVAETAEAATVGAIASAGPLESINVTPDLNCDVRYAGDTDPQFYAAIACGTLVAVDGTLYGPQDIPAGGAAGPRTAFTALSQTGPTGSGTAADPFVVVTKVDLGSSGISLTETDTYVAGAQSYTTRVRLTNTSGAQKTAVVYRAGDCYVANSDYGTGRVTEESVACVGAGGRIAQWTPLTGGSSYIEGSYNDVWAAIGSQQMFPDTAREDENIDNGAGLSWRVTMEAEGAADVAHITAFSNDALVVDRDGDGLLDQWETDGLDADGDGTVDVDLPAMGASPDHKDLFVEVDWMTDPGSCILWWCWGRRDFAPQQAALDDVRTAMWAAPVQNLDGVPGVRLHVDGGPSSVMNPLTGALWGAHSKANQVAFDAELGTSTASGYDWTEFNALKAANFDAARADVFHYTIFGDRYGTSESSGIAQVTDANFRGDSFLVTDGPWETGFSRREEAGTFMHEFGHTLSLRHGGGDNTHNKPNYQSIMSYFWQMGSRTLDYSRADLGILDEGALSEADGLPGASGNFAWFCPGGGQRTSSTTSPVDWSCDGATDAGIVSVDTNGDGSTDVLAGFDDWEHLVYDGGAVGAFGTGDFRDQDPPPTLTPDDEATYSELRERGLLGAAGDGSVAVTGPTVLLPGTTGQQLRLAVSNVGPAPAQYDLGLSGVPGLPAAATATVDAGVSLPLDVPVDAASLVPGSYRLTVELRAPGSAEVLSTAAADVLVPDLTDPTVRSQAEEILQHLATPQPGLDETLRSRAVESLNSALHAPATVTPTSGDQQSTAVSTTFAEPLRVTVLDDQGAPVPSAPVTFTVTDGSAAFGSAAGVTVNADAQGSATAPALTAGSAAGPVTVLASSGAASATFTLMVTPAGTSPADVTVTIGAPPAAATGSPFTLTVTVTNTGSQAVSNVRTSVWVPRSATVQAPPGAATNGARTIVTAPSLAPGQSLTYRFTVTKKAQGVLPISATSTSSTAEGDFTSNRASVQVG